MEEVHNTKKKRYLKFISATHKTVIKFQWEIHFLIVKSDFISDILLNQSHNIILLNISIQLILEE